MEFELFQSSQVMSGLKIMFPAHPNLDITSAHIIFIGATTPQIVSPDDSGRYQTINAPSNRYRQCHFLT
jgi:hypothetical protein